ncbi:hypothetical protein LSTR_LSTR008640 [Laodelphax striatellus]|uniref:Aminopeptidase n=1 Tax=Laodelphax striatellus TaxID=195883 RepID=A0A482WM33_LAOST|nr:hypothetical protein LSTR_LSTR008640 [Laodelphax striatellus]
MYFWTHEPGFPLLMVERDQDGSINLTQKRFLMTNASGEQPVKSAPRWWIPLSYTTSTELDFNDTRPREWFNVSNACHQVEINLDDDEWILFNIQLAGYYRVNYDPHTWNLLIDDMVNCEFPDIHPLNRAQLLDDAFTLASAGYLNYATALNLSRYLAHETDIIPWTTAFDVFKTLEAKLIGTPARPLFRHYIQMLVSNWYSSIKFKDDDQSDCATNQLTRMRTVALSCGFGHPGCVDRALKQVYLLMSEAETEIPTDLEDILLCTAVNAGPEEVWQFVRKQYMSTTSRKKRESYLEAMACSQDPNKIMQMLEDSLDVKSEFFKNNEGNTLIGALVRRKTNSETMLNFFYKNAQEISALYGPEDLQNYFMFATLHLNPIQIDELHSFMEGKMKQLNLTGINKVFSIEKYIATMKQAETNTWYASYYHDIYRWLREENETLETSTETDSTLETTRPTSPTTESSTRMTYSTKMSTFDYVTEDSESTTDHDQFSNFRLNNYIHPVHYDLQLDLFISDRYYKGTVDIEMMSKQEIPPSATHIELNSKGLDLDSYSVKLMKNDKPVKLGAIMEQYHLEKVTFLLNENLETDTSYLLHIEFQGDFAVDENVGLLLRSYTDEDNVTRINSKGEKIIWSIFQQTPPISPSSIGIFVSNMETVTGNGIKIWATNRNRAEQISKQSHFELFHTTMQSMSLIHLQIPLNLVFVPDLHVETFDSFGIVYIRSDELEQKMSIESVSGSIVADIMSNSESFIVEIAKQVAVQYFGHMVTPKWWSDIWLRESLSQYCGLLMACKLDNDKSYKDLIPPMLRNQVFDKSFGNSGMIAGNFNSSTQIIQSSSSSGTKKGLSLLFMLSDILGDSIFFQGVSSYLKKFFLGSATTQDLIEEWENQIKMNNITMPYNFTLGKILRPWLESDDEPILNIQRIQEQTHSNLIISQMLPPNIIHNTYWYVPVDYISAKDTNYTTNPIENWLGPHVENGMMTNGITIKNASGVNDWIILNPKGIGVYRVAYDPISWELLMHQLKQNLTEIPTAARSLLIYDTFSLASDGIGHYSNALKLADYLENETSFLPWFSAFEAFEALESRLHHNEALYESFRTYLSNLVQVLYWKLGFPSHNVDGKSDQEDFLNILLRSKTVEWACKYDIDDCVEKATFTVKQYLAGNLTKIQDEYMDAIVCGGLSEADSQTWNEAYNNLNHASKMRDSLILGLGCSKNPHLIQSYLDKTLNDNIMKSNDMIEAFSGIYRRHYNYQKALNFLGMNIGSIQHTYNNETFNKLLIGISKYATTIHHFEQINQISTTIDSNADLTLALSQTHKSVQELENWMTTNEKDLSEFFNKRNTNGEFSESRKNEENILLLGFLVLYSIASNLL